MEKRAWKVVGVKRGARGVFEKHEAPLTQKELAADLARFAGVVAVATDGDVFDEVAVAFGDVLFLAKNATAAKFRGVEIVDFLSLDGFLPDNPADVHARTVVEKVNVNGVNAPALMAQNAYGEKSRALKIKDTGGIKTSAILLEKPDYEISPPPPPKNIDGVVVEFLLGEKSVAPPLTIPKNVGVDELTYAAGYLDKVFKWKYGDGECFVGVKARVYVEFPKQISGWVADGKKFRISFSK